jgi:hypothetical protein
MYQQQMAAMQAQQAQQMAQMQAALAQQQAAAAAAQQQAAAAVIASQQAAAVSAAPVSYSTGSAGPLQHGHKYRFRACSGHNLAVQDGKVHGMGAEGPLATWTVHVVGPNKVTMVNDAGATIAVDKSGRPCQGSGADAIFTVSGNEKELHFAAPHGGHLGILPDGEAKAAGQTGTGPHGSYIVLPVSGASSGQSHDPFANGARVLLHSKATGKTLRIMEDGSVNGEGGDGKWAQLVVERKGSDVLFKHPATGKYLRVNEKLMPDGIGIGGDRCHFTIVPHGDGRTYSFKANTAGGHLGILPNGHPKSSSETGTGDHGSFTVSNY